MTTIGTMIKRIAGLQGTKDINEWEDSFIGSVIDKTAYGKETTGLSPKQVQIIEHIHNTRLYLTEVLRVLAPGGTMVMTSENLRRLSFAKEAYALMATIWPASLPFCRMIKFDWYLRLNFPANLRAMARRLTARKFCSQ